MPHPIRSESGVRSARCRNLACVIYSVCLDFAEINDWPGWICSRCAYREISSIRVNLMRDVATRVPSPNVGCGNPSIDALQISYQS